MPNRPQPPELVHVAHLDIEVGAPIEVGSTAAGIRRVIPIIGGRVTGTDLNGQVLPGGADFQLIRSATETVVEARYVLRCDDGDVVYVDNQGLRTGSAADIERLRRDEPVDPSRIYFRSTPRFETASARLKHLENRIFVGVGTRQPRAVAFDFFEVR